VNNLFALFGMSIRIEKVTISRYKLKTFLCRSGGFGLYFYNKNSNSFQVIQDNDGLVSEASLSRSKNLLRLCNEFA
jgi:hypothetical protein